MLLSFLFILPLYFHYNEFNSTYFVPRSYTTHQFIRDNGADLLSDRIFLVCIILIKRYPFRLHTLSSDKIVRTSKDDRHVTDG